MATSCFTDGIRPDHRVYILDKNSGTVQFGDGENGHRPSPGAPIQANYQYGSGQFGNINKVSLSGFFPEANQLESLKITTQGQAINFQHGRGKLTWRWRVAYWLCDWFLKIMN